MFYVLSCNTDLGSCCNDVSLSVSLNVARRILNLIQLIVPILLIVFAMIGFIKLLNNPETKNGTKSIINKFLAAVVVFIVPIIVDILLGVIPNSFQLAACWKDASYVEEKIRANTYDYAPIYDNNDYKKIIRNDDYEKGDKTIGGGGSGQSTVVRQGSATGQAIVVYAKSYVGKPYVWGGDWNGEVPYTGTDCSGFVQGVYKHFGIQLERTTSEQWADTSKYTVASDIRAGDLIMYDGHVGILTGNGTEIVHAKGSKWGVVIDPDYRSYSSHAIRGIMRIKGVN